MQFTALLHHITPQLLTQSLYALRRDAAVGVDGMSWREYEEGLLQRLTDLHGRLHSGAYRATPSRRVYIPKADGRQRPLGVASLEDKIVQQAVGTVLNAIYEEDFLGFSYGFRPGRSQHDALDALTVALKSQKVNWILDADITSFFYEIDHEWMLMFLGHRVADRRLLGLICKWLQAGVMENGRRVAATKGTPPRRGDIAAFGEYLSSLRAGSVGKAVAPPACPWRYGCCALCRRQRGGFQEAIAGSAVPGAVAGTPGQVWPISQCGENTAD